MRNTLGVVLAAVALAATGAGGLLVFEASTAAPPAPPPARFLSTAFIPAPTSPGARGHGGHGGQGDGEGWGDRVADCPWQHGRGETTLAEGVSALA